jgi:hypothetical protein
MPLNSTQKINRARRARGLRPWGPEDFQVRTRAMTRGALMRNLTFSLIFGLMDWSEMTRAERVDGARRLREAFDTNSVLRA